MYPSTDPFYVAAARSSSFKAHLRNTRINRALLEGVKDRMREFGPAYGSNPDYESQADDQHWMEVRATWTRELMDRLLAEHPRHKYVPAARSMQSTAPMPADEC